MKEAIFIAFIAGVAGLTVLPWAMVLFVFWRTRKVWRNGAWRSPE